MLMFVNLNVNYNKQNGTSISRNTKHTSMNHNNI
jgi:hypothetical protein